MCTRTPLDVYIAKPNPQSPSPISDRFPIYKISRNCALSINNPRYPRRANARVGFAKSAAKPRLAWIEIELALLKQQTAPPGRIVESIFGWFNITSLLIEGTKWPAVVRSSHYPNNMAASGADGARESAFHLRSLSGNCGIRGGFDSVRGAIQFRRCSNRRRDAPRPSFFEPLADPGLGASTRLRKLRNSWRLAGPSNFR